MKKDAKNILINSINIKTHNISNTIVDYYMHTCKYGTNAIIGYHTINVHL
jgi:hypothetical protein